jgi:uncharacterized Fe-S cluster protein YjdI
MSGKLQTYEGELLTVTFNPTVCTHSGNCVRGLSSVFNVTSRPWVKMDGAAAEQIEAQVARCPSGALQILRKVSLAP